MFFGVVSVEERLYSPKDQLE